MKLQINDNEFPCERLFVYFHGYKIYRTGAVYGKKGKLLKTEERKRQGREKTDLTVRLYYNGKSKKWTLHRLIAACFLGPIDGYEINHKDRNTHNCCVENLERVTSSENTRHYYKHKKEFKNA